MDDTCCADLLGYPLVSLWPGRRMQARDLSLSVDPTSGQPTLLQAFVPELQRLRRNHTNDPSEAFGQQLELYLLRPIYM